VSNIGAGAAVAVVIFCCLLIFSFLFFRFSAGRKGCEIRFLTGFGYVFFTAAVAIPST
jgi:hypothetical protein